MKSRLKNILAAAAITASLLAPCITQVNAEGKNPAKPSPTPTAGAEWLEEVNKGAKNQVEAINNINMGNVSIRIDELTSDNAGGKSSAFQQGRVVVPGQRVSKIVNIYNEGEPAWIRAKVTFDSKAPVNLEEKDVEFASNNKDWVKRGKWWYYTKPVKHNGSIPFIDGIQIPAEWTSEDIGGSLLNVNIRTDAVQERHFTPDFRSDDPWFGTVIEESLYNYTRDDDATDIRYLVAYEGGAEGLIKKGDDFFSNWHTLMPGDVWEDTTMVANSYDSEVMLYFRTENEHLTELEKQCNLKIWAGETLIYDGPLSGTLKEFNLADMMPGTQFVLKYRLEVPSGLDNNYDLSDGQVKWVFRAVALRRHNTGDTREYIGYAIAGGIAAVLVIILIVKKRKDKAKQE